ncbi:MADS-box transcription factor MPF1 [Striga asiatica]|uniref:MADS-box transcription factor MPF1 n=1 Tax=Striga asiatica TaxID=4170 RepID=A0A5A7QBZ6_STRAF|nr:MADS-box transcription factor MPF1 [Striga asiatica]
MGEELQGLGFHDLARLEKLVEIGLSRVGKTKNDKLLIEINKLKTKASSKNPFTFSICGDLDSARDFECTLKTSNDQRSSAESIANSHGLLNNSKSLSDTSLKWVCFNRLTSDYMSCI